MVPDILGIKYPICCGFWVVSYAYSTKQSRDFVKQGALNEFNFTLIMKSNLENRIFYLCPLYWPVWKKNVFKRKIRAHLKKKNFNEEHFDVARTRKCAEYSLDEEMRWLHSTPTYGGGGARSVTCLKIIELNKVRAQKMYLKLWKVKLFLNPSDSPF